MLHFLRGGNTLTVGCNDCSFSVKRFIYILCLSCKNTYRGMVQLFTQTLGGMVIMLVREWFALRCFMGGWCCFPRGYGIPPPLNSSFVYIRVVSRAQAFEIGSGRAWAWILKYCWASIGPDARAKSIFSVSDRVFAIAGI